MKHNGAELCPLAVPKLFIFRRFRARN
ncbi:hypothetical protein SBA6_30024 [Candidatus Sulfopaludibacter sp. SbA6]|nr:hypothetical protein SBA6_30024 [Candidatus Sulfopaludibacter sp. SbA6]